jgi:class 3 adenylate cyclase
LSRANWSVLLPALKQLRVRIGMHTGEPLVAHHPDGTPDYFGPVVNRAARIGAAGHGGQVLLSAATQAVAQAGLPAEIGCLDLGLQRLKGVGQERLSQVCHPDLPHRFPPLRTLDVSPHNLPLQLTGLVGREGETRELQRLLHTARLVTLTGPGGGR